MLRQSIWFAVVTVTTIGYGDKTPRSKCGRILTLVWMFIGLALFGITAGTVSSELTVARSTVTIASAADLSNMLVAAIDGSTGADFAKEQQASVRAVSNDSQLVDLLLSGVVKAAVHDYPVLLHLAASNISAGALEVTLLIFLLF